MFGQSLNFGALAGAGGPVSVSYLVIGGGGSGWFMASSLWNG